MDIIFKKSDMAKDLFAKRVDVDCIKITSAYDLENSEIFNSNLGSNSVGTEFLSYQNHVCNSFENSSYMKFSKQHARTLKCRFCKVLCKDKAIELFNELRKSHTDEEKIQITKQ